MTLAAITDRSSLEAAILASFVTTTPVEFFLVALAQAEAYLNTNLRVRQQVGRSTANASSRFTSLPTDYLGMIGVQLNTDPVRHLEYRRPDMMDELRVDYNAANDPIFFSIIGDEIELMPVPDEALQLELTYYKALDALDADGATNWLLTGYPHIYFAATSWFLATYLGDMAKAAAHQNATEMGLQQMRVEDDLARYPTGKLVTMPRRSFG